MKRVPKRLRLVSLPTAGFWLLSLTCLITLAGLLFTVYGLGEQDSLAVGTPSPQTFRAPVAVDVVNQLATERERQVARSQVEVIYSSEPQAQRLVINAISSAGLPAEVQALLITAYQHPAGVSSDKRAELISESLALSPVERRRDVRLLLESILLTTAKPNDSLTEAARAAAAAAVRPIMQSLQAGQIIVNEDDILSADHLRVMEALGIYSARATANQRLATSILSCLLLAIILTSPLLFVYRRLRNLSTIQLSFLVLTSLIVVVAQRFTFLLNTHFLFIAIVCLLVAVLISELGGVLWAVWLAVIMALLEPGSPLFTLFISLTAGLSAALLARTFKNRTSVFFAGLASGLIAAIAYSALLIVHGGGLTLASLPNLLLICAGGLLAGILALGLLPLAESSFGFLTEFRLIELSNPSTPLLQKLLLEAPGSYQHSLIISNLVEQAVTNIGGNALLARVGALYHDVGKLKRPHFFVENQLAGENPHNQISPHLSYLIITSHVRDGVDLLREYKLPKALEPFIVEHHGTTVLSYFYKRALEDSDRLDELNFRYPGPKPQTKESAVLFLADAVESASRTLSEPSQGSIRALIDRLFDMRLQDGQLSESPLNFHDLEVVANTFERMMTAILHRRIAYPSQEEIKGLQRARDNRRNQAVSSS